MIYEEERLLALRVAEAGQDRDALRDIADLLRGRSEPWVGKVRLKIARQLATAKTQAAHRTSAGFDFTTRYGLVPADGRWLYRYHLKDPAFELLYADVRHAASSGKLDRGAAPALFVLWASEWFRRRYHGEGHRWESLAAALGIVSDQNVLRQITARGLALWRRPVIAGEHGRYFLSTLAREGGFPASAIEQGGKGWAMTVLGAIVAPLLAEPAPDVEQAQALAQTQREKLPHVYRDDDFLLLCADLALAIVMLRREAKLPAARLGLPIAAWLSLHRPDWRDALPITTEDSAAAALVDGLMRVEAQPLAGAAIRALRFLERHEGGWREAAQLELDGGLSGDLASGLDPMFGRLRAHAAGELARALPGELAMVEPPAQGEKTWASRSFGRSRGLKTVPLSTPIDLDLRAGERRAARLQIHGGAPRRGRLLVCTIAAGGMDAPSLLKIEGSGSGAYRAETVVIQAPVDWRIEATVGETIAPLGPGVGATALWHVAGGAYATTPDGDRYRIRTAQSADRRDRIELIGNHVGWARTDSDIDLFCGPPHVRTSDSGRGKLFLRRIGATDWVKAPSPLPLGHYDIGWRDARLLLDRRRVAVLPGSAQLRTSGLGRDARFRLDGWEAARLEPSMDAPVRVISDAEWIGRPVTRPTHRFDATLHWPGATMDSPLSVTVDYPSQAGIARWDGSVVPGGTRISLAELRELVAFDSGHMLMFAELFEPGQRQTAASMTWEYDEEMPMSVPAADIASLLLPAPIDAELRLGMHDGIETYWHVGQFGARLVIETGGVVASKGVVAPNARLVGRSLTDPAREVDFGAYSLVEDANHRPLILPDTIGGTWLLYLRDGSTILSRPNLYDGAAPAIEGMTPLARAMAMPPWAGLDEALATVLDCAGGDEAKAVAILEELNALVASLGGLPPATFRVLAMLRDYPDVLTRMVMMATTEQQPAVLALSDALPFAWCALPAGCWQGAQRLRFETALTLLQSLGDATRYAIEMVDTVRRTAIEREPLLRPILLPHSALTTLRETAQAFLNHAVDRIQGSRASCFRPLLGDRLPGYFLTLPDHCLEALDAPCAAALAVTDAWRPEPAHIRTIKSVARTFPTYFADAFAASLSEYSHG